MRIIDKHQDFYDYYSYIYGVDNKVTFDRRGSSLITNYEIYAKDSRLYNWNFNLSNKIFHLFEVGYTQYILCTEGIKMKPEKLHQFGYDELDFNDCVFSIAHVYHEFKHFSKTPLALYQLKLKENWKKFNRKVEYPIPSLEEAMKLVEADSIIENPIISNTFWTRILNPESIWKELQNYISSLNNDKDISIEMTEKQKADIHGFDKNSFRHPIK